MYQFRKSELVTKNEFPTQSEIKQCLGDDLAALLYEQSDQKTKEFLGLIPPLNGIENPIWISPENHIKHRNILTPVPKSDEIKTFTHQTILDLGDNLMRNMQMETERRAKQFQRIHMTEQRLMMEAAKRNSIDSITQKTYEEFNNYLEILRNDFQLELQNELKDHSERYKKEFQKAISEERTNLTHKLLSLMRQEINLIITSLYDDFESIKRNERENLIAHFNNFLRNHCVRMDENIQTCRDNNCQSKIPRKKKIKAANRKPNSKRQENNTDFSDFLSICSSKENLH